MQCPLPPTSLYPSPLLVITRQGRDEVLQKVENTVCFFLLLFLSLPPIQVRRVRRHRGSRLSSRRQDSQSHPCCQEKSVWEKKKCTVLVQITFKCWSSWVSRSNVKPCRHSQVLAINTVFFQDNFYIFVTLNWNLKNKQTLLQWRHRPCDDVDGGAARRTTQLNTVCSVKLIRSSHMTKGESLAAHFDDRVCNNQMTTELFSPPFNIQGEWISIVTGWQHTPSQLANKRSVHTDVDALAVQTASTRLTTRSHSLIFRRTQSHWHDICLTLNRRPCAHPVQTNVAVPTSATVAVLSKQATSTVLFPIADLSCTRLRGGVRFDSQLPRGQGEVISLLHYSPNTGAAGRFVIVMHEHANINTNNHPHSKASNIKGQVCNTLRLLGRRSDIWWWNFRFRCSFTLEISHKICSKLRWPASTNLDIRSTSFFIGIFKNVSGYPKYYIRWVRQICRCKMAADKSELFYGQKIKMTLFKL